MSLETFGVWTISITVIAYTLFWSTVEHRSSPVPHDYGETSTCTSWVPIINIIFLMIHVYYIFKGYFVFRPWVKNGVYFLPLLSLGLLYFM